MCVSGLPAGAGLSQPSDTKATGINRRLSCRQRLSESRLFRQTFDAGRRYAGRFVVMWLRHAEDASLRLAVIVSKRTFRRSVDRSRAKRLMRESFRLNRHMLRGKVDIILVARRYIDGVQRQVVDEDLLRLARQAGILAERIPAE